MTTVDEAPAPTQSPAASSAGGGSAASPGSTLLYGLAMRFKVTIKGSQDSAIDNLGMWSSCDGLKVSFGVSVVKSGGEYAYEQVLPEAIKYQNVTLKRGMLAKDSQNLQAWLSTVAKGWQDSSYQGATVGITLYDATRHPVVTWSLLNAYPVAWTGPSMNAAENKVAIESLEFVHQGFLRSG
jgi:phage tail-like protein